MQSPEKDIPKLTIRVATEKDIEAVDQLRIGAYKSATWFTADDYDRLKVAADPEGTFVLVAEPHDQPGSLLGTVAIAVSQDRKALENAVGASLEGRDLDFPCATVMRLATAENARGMCINHILRACFVEKALQDGLEFFCSSQAKGTPNIEAMKQLGYRFEEVPSSLMSTVKVADDSLMLNWLNRNDFEETLRKIHAYLTAKNAPRWELVA
ncbi:hypothetical protein [Acidovorax sp. sic0104]|uniref:hypothetical protein n=1 Tax=Acidovorax sp. sic0104 TaxID=2854784 RepID=UPI001C455886|nr:hypothetical protein [Acidovorax sp. sic0104]MBV7541983.1 hypothetical protein [Acidovorax sp. sic0104]